MKKYVFITAMLMLGFWSCKKDSKPLPDGSTGTVSDVEGNVYKTVKIGDQWWMAENLKTTKLNDGTPIPVVLSDQTWSDVNITSPMVCYYNNDFANVASFGMLYNWYAVNTGKLAPAGWHVPTDADWDKLITYLGGSSVAGAKLKEQGDLHWTSSNKSTNSSGFSAIGGGFRGIDGLFFWINAYNGNWTATESDLSYSYSYSLSDDKDEIFTQIVPKHIGFSIRCVKD